MGDLNKTHFKLAHSFGLKAEQIHIFQTTEELRQRALELVVDKNVVDQYTDSTWGLNIRDKPDSGVLNCQIFIREEAHTPGAQATFDRLEQQQLNPSLRLLDSDGELFYAFLLLHEIAHAQLNHSDPNDCRDLYEAQELEADKWACSKLNEYWVLSNASQSETVKQ